MRGELCVSSVEPTEPTKPTKPTKPKKRTWRVLLKDMTFGNNHTPLITAERLVIKKSRLTFYTNNEMVLVIAKPFWRTVNLLPEEES